MDQEKKEVKEVQNLKELNDIDFITVYSRHFVKFFKCADGKNCKICEEQARRFEELSDEEKLYEVQGELMAE